MPDHLIMKVKGHIQGDIEGECKKDKHEGHIDINSIEFGITVPADMARGGSGSIGGMAQAQLVSITKRADKSSVKLFNAIKVNEVLDEIVITYQFQGGETLEYQTVTLTDSMLTSWHQSGHESGEPIESLTITYSKIKFEYQEQADGGGLEAAITGEWDVKATK